MNGVDLLIKVRKDPKLARIPFVIASATVEHSEIVRAIKCGVSEYIVKPFSPKILKERLIRAIENPVKSVIKDKHESEVKKEQLQVLVVDDVPDNIQVIADIIKGDFKVKAATDGAKALKICASKSPPDIVLLDIMMPGMSGLEVCKKLKDNPATQHITVIFLTALDQTKDIVKGFELGAVDYITKPINPPVVIARINTHAKLVNNHKSMKYQVDTLLENERLKQEFDRVMQNDLRHPIDEMLKTVGMLKQFSKDPTRVGQYSDTLLATCNYLQQMIDNMLLLYKLEEGSYDLAPVKINLSVIVAKILETFKTSISNKRLEIYNNTDEDSFALGEELLTSSLISNLVENAIEAAPRGSVISMKTALENGFQTLRINNTGTIPAEITDNFFGKYVTAGKKSGSGIGTYAAKLMVDIQKGVIEFESTEQSGTTLMVAIPQYS